MDFFFGNLAFPAIVFYFSIYSFIGWVLENSFSYSTGRPFLKDNFLKGPFKPMYGFAPVLLILLISPGYPLPIILLLCLLVPTIIEYITGAILYGVFHLRYWDYSNERWQLHGHICLNFCAIWLVLSFFTIRFVQPLVALLYESIQQIWVWFYPTVVLYFGIELVFSLKRHLSRELAEEKEPHPVQ